VARDRTLGLKLKAFDKMSATIERVRKKFPKLTRDVKRASRTFKIFSAQTKRLRQNFQKIGGGMKSFGRNLTIFVTLPLIAAGAAGVKFFAEFQQGLRGIEKTTGLARSEVAKLGKIFDQLSTEIPVTTKEMFELAQAGGQLGVKGTANIEKFTITMAKLGRASDVTGEAGAKSIARILKVTGDGIGKIDRFSSALVDLGNNAAAGEEEILQVALRVAGQIGRFDVASDKVLGISTALKALGKNAESSGSVVGRSFDAINQAIEGGGLKMEFLSRLTGIANKDLKKSFKEDATAVFQKFVVGLNKVDKAGGNQIKVLAALGLQGIRINDILLTLAKRPEVLAENLDRATKAFKENTALQKEFEVQTDSLGSEFKILANTFVSLLTIIGEQLAPTVKFFGKILKGIFDFLRNNPTVLKLVVVFGAFAAVLGPVLFLLGALIVILPALIAGFAAIGVTSLAAFLPFILGAAAIAAIIAVVTILIAKWDELIAFFDQNPFLSTIKSLFLMLTPIGQVISAIKLLIASFSGLDAVKGVLSDILPSFISEALFGKKGAGKVNEALPSKDLFGPKRGARKANEGVAAKGTVNTTEVGGNIGIILGGAVPSGTKANVKSFGPVGLDFGFAGGIQ